jgi:hypothetical protein
MSPAQVESLGRVIDEFKLGAMDALIANNAFMRLFGK